MSEMDYLKRIPKRRLIAVALMTLAAAVWPALATGISTETEARAQRVTI